MMIQYSIDRSTLDQIIEHLEVAKGSFIPPLDRTVDIKTYANKIHLYANRIEAWEEKKMVGLVAIYLNQAEKSTAFITNVSVIPTHTSLGISKKLLNDCIALAKEYGFQNIQLEVNAANEKAINLYKKFNFTKKNSKENTLTLNLKLN